MIRKAGAVLAILMVAFGCGKDDQPKDIPPPPTPGNSIADLIAQDTAFSSLAKVIRSNNYEDELSDPNVEITFLAPSNDAFRGHLDTIPANTVEEWDSLVDGYKFLTYWTVKGKYNLQSMHSGVYTEQYCTMDEEWLCDEILVENKGGVLIFNGGDQFGAVSTGRVIEADNGSIIEITAVPKSQPALEALSDASFMYDTEFFRNMVGKTSSFLQTGLKVGGWADLLVTDEANLLKVFDVYLQNFLDEEDLDALLTTSQRDSLLARYNVSTTQDLLMHVSLDDLQNFAGNTSQDIYDQLEEEDFTGWLEHVVITEGTIDYILAENPSSKVVKSRAGVSYTVSLDGQGSILLTDTAGKVIKLSERMMDSYTGDLYLVSDVY